MASIKRLAKATPEELKDINELIHQLSPRLPACSIELLDKIVHNPDTELWVVVDKDRIVGMGTLAVVTIPEGQRGQIEDIVVHEQYRGHGLGELISKKLIERAQERKIRSLSLSSRADRVAANKLYQKLGFSLWPTNVYQLKFE